MPEHDILAMETTGKAEGEHRMRWRGFKQSSAYTSNISFPVLSPLPLPYPTQLLQAAMWGAKAAVRRRPLLQRGGVSLHTHILEEAGLRLPLVPKLNCTLPSYCHAQQIRHRDTGTWRSGEWQVAAAHYQMDTSSCLECGVLRGPTRTDHRDSDCSHSRWGDQRTLILKTWGS